MTSPRCENPGAMSASRFILPEAYRCWIPAPNFVGGRRAFGPRNAHNSGP